MDAAVRKMETLKPFRTFYPLGLLLGLLQFSLGVHVFVELMLVCRGVDAPDKSE